MAQDITTKAKNNAAMVPNKTPAPTRPAKIPAPDVISTVRAEQNAGNHYGLNGYTGASSINPSEKVISPLAQSLKSASEKGSDPVLDAVASRGVGAGGIDPMTGDIVTMAEGFAGTQVRRIGSGNVVSHPRMKNANTGGAPRGAVPASTEASNGTLARKPGR